jgi:S1-C subfamily serine protease
MSEPGRTALGQFSDEIAELSERVVRSTAMVSGQTKQFKEGGGSAWLYDAEHLVTNDHVIDELIDPVEVQFANEAPTRALVIGRDNLTDLAVLRVDRQEIEPLRVSARPARLGELCFAFGSPLGEFPESVSIGIVSGLKRRYPHGERWAIFDMIQTDCAINFGNSGGPLVNADGFVIGVNTASRAEADDIGVAIPADTVADIIAELLTHGSIERASLGVGVALRPTAGVPGGEAMTVTSVKDDAAGPFQRGDVILAVKDRQILSQNDLLRALRRDVANRRVPVLVLRDGQQVTIDCLLRSTQS